MLCPSWNRGVLSIRMNGLTVCCVTAGEIPVRTQLASFPVARPALMKCCAAAQKSALPRPGWLKAKPLLNVAEAKWYPVPPATPTLQAGSEKPWSHWHDWGVGNPPLFSGRGLSIGDDMPAMLGWFLVNDSLSIRWVMP